MPAAAVALLRSRSCAARALSLQRADPGAPRPAASPPFAGGVKRCVGVVVSTWAALLVKRL